MEYYYVSISDTEFDSFWIVKATSEKESIDYVKSLIKSDPEEYLYEIGYLSGLQSFKIEDNNLLLYYRNEHTGWG